MKTLCIRNGRVLDPSRQLDDVRDVWIVDGVFAEGGFHVDRADEEIDASGMLVMPGLVDVHVHLREPGNETAETIASGCAAALAGGFTSIICMPNTTPPLDTPERVRAVIEKAEAIGGPHVYVMPTITKGREGKVLADLEALADAGAIAFTDDGSGVQDVALVRKAMEKCAALGLPFVEHCEDARFAGDGTMHDGAAAKRLGLRGIPAQAEWAMVERDIAECECTGARLHLQHLSARESVELIRKAVERGVRVTAEATPHHLTLSDADIVEPDTNLKMNPPLRTAEDRAALIEALRDGIVGMVATDHAPHTAASKARAFAEAPCGVIGMETAAGVVWTRLVAEGSLTALEMANRMSTAGAVAFGLPAGTLSAGQPADVTLMRPSCEWTVDTEAFQSLSSNCPFAGWQLRGRISATIVDGQVKYRDTLH